MKTFYKITITVMTASALVTAGSLAYSWYTQTHQEDTTVTTVATPTSTEETTTSTEETTTTEEATVDYSQYDTLNVIQWVDGDTILLGDYPWNVYDIVGLYLIIGTYDQQMGQVYTLVYLGNGNSPMHPINDYDAVVNAAVEQSKGKMYEKN